MRFTAEVEGVEKITQQLRERFAGVRGRVVTALSALGAQTRDDAASKVPVRTGALKAAISAKVSAGDKAISLIVWPKKPKGRRKNYARYVEAGTLNRAAIARVRELRSAKRAMFEAYQRERAAGNMRTQPHPFMAPARANMRARVTDVLMRAIGVGLEG